jgi:PAS domain-containing protein
MGTIMPKTSPKPQPGRRASEFAEEFQRRVLDSAIAAVSIVDSEGRFLTVSQRAVEVTGYSNRED